MDIKLLTKKKETTAHPGINEKNIQPNIGRAF